MFWYVLWGFLAAFGALCALWAVFGLLLSGSARCQVSVRIPKGKEIAVIRRFCRLREFGLTRSDLTVLDSSLSPAQMRIIRKKYPFVKFLQRKEQSHEPGTGDFTGNHRSGGLPEL